VPEQLGNYRRLMSVCPIAEAVHGGITDEVKRNPGADLATVEIDVHCCLCRMAGPAPAMSVVDSRLGQQLTGRGLPAAYPPDFSGKNTDGE
jgi:hypothetical protein